MYGDVNIDGQRYIERYQVFGYEQAITVNNQLLTSLSVKLPGVANFLLKGLTRTVLVSGAPSTARPFRFRLGNSDGMVWYQSGGVGGTNDRILDSLVFGNGQFPYVPIPYIFYTANAAINFEIEDVSAAQPYTIYFGFHGSYLIPASA